MYDKLVLYQKPIGHTLNSDSPPRFPYTNHRDLRHHLVVKVTSEAANEATKWPGLHHKD